MNQNQQQPQVNMDIVAQSLLGQLSESNKKVAMLEAQLIQVEQYAQALQLQLAEKEKQCQECEVDAKADEGEKDTKSE